MGDKKVSAADFFPSVSQEPATATPGTPAARISPKDIFVPAEDVGKPTPITAPESWADVPEAYVKNAGQIALETLNAIPGAAQKAIKEPSKAAESVARGGTHMIKSLLSAAGLPLTLPAWAIASMVPKLPGAKKSMGEQFREDYLEPGFALGRGMAEDYGGWLGGDEGWGFTPEKGLERLKKTITTKPYSFTGDVVGLPGAVGTIVRGGKSVAKIGHITDAAEAATQFGKLGIDIDHLTQSQLARLQEAANAAGWDKDAIARARREMLFSDAGINPTSSMLSGSEVERRTEDAMRAGTKGPRAQEIIDAADAERRAAFDTHVNNTRTGISGATTPLNPEGIGKSLQERWNAAHEAARQKVNEAYKRAFNLDELVANGIPTSVPHDTIKGLPDLINQKAADKGLTINATLTPNAKEAKRLAEEYAKTGRLPETLFGEPMVWGNIDASSWEAVDALRKQLSNLRTRAKEAATKGDATDLKVTRLVLDAFDEQFGKANPLLNEARKAHSERIKAFDPNRLDAPSGFKALTNVLNNAENSGKTIYDTLFESGNFNAGRASAYFKKLMKTFENDPAAQSTIREGLINRITHDPKSFDTLSPQRMVTAIDEALDGRRADIYKMVLGPDISRLKQMREVADEYAKHTRKENPSGSGHTIEHHNRADKIAGRWGDVSASIAGLLGGLGGVSHAGATGAAGAALGIPAYHAGRIAGRTIGVPIDTLLQGRKAQRLANPEAMTPMPPPMSLPVRGALGVSALSNAESQPRSHGGHLSTLRRR